MDYSLPEQWRKELDNHGIIGLVSADLSKAFDMLLHDLIVLKLWKYGADEKTIDSIKDYRSGRQQRVKLGSGFFWQTIARGIPRRSIPEPPIFNILMNDLHCAINHTSLSTYADETQIFYTGDFRLRKLKWPI